jgi:PHD-finger
MKKQLQLGALDSDDEALHCARSTKLFKAAAGKGKQQQLPFAPISSSGSSSDSSGESPFESSAARSKSKRSSKSTSNSSSSNRSTASTKAAPARKRLLKKSALSYSSSSSSDDGSAAAVAKPRKRKLVKTGAAAGALNTSSSDDSDIAATATAASGRTQLQHTHLSGASCSGGSSSSQAGRWKCSCGTSVRAIRSQCSLCGESRPAVQHRDDVPADDGCTQQQHSGSVLVLPAAAELTAAEASSSSSDVEIVEHCATAAADSKKRKLTTKRKHAQLSSDDELGLRDDTAAAATTAVTASSARRAAKRKLQSRSDSNSDVEEVAAPTPPAAAAAATEAAASSKWQCPGCDNLYNMSRLKCRLCGIEQPAGDETTTADAAAAAASHSSKQDAAGYGSDADNMLFQYDACDGDVDAEAEAYDEPDCGYSPAHYSDDAAAAYGECDLYDPASVWGPDWKEPIAAVAAVDETILQAADDGEATEQPLEHQLEHQSTQQQHTQQQQQQQQVEILAASAAAPTISEPPLAAVVSRADVVTAAAPDATAGAAVASNSIVFSDADAHWRWSQVQSQDDSCDDELIDSQSDAAQLFPAVTSFLPSSIRQHCRATAAGSADQHLRSAAHAIVIPTPPDFECEALPAAAAVATAAQYGASSSAGADNAVVHKLQALPEATAAAVSTATEQAEVATTTADTVAATAAFCGGNETVLQSPVQGASSSAAAPQPVAAAAVQATTVRKPSTPTFLSPQRSARLGFFGSPVLSKQTNNSAVKDAGSVGGSAEVAATSAARTASTHAAAVQCAAEQQVQSERGHNDVAVRHSDAEKAIVDVNASAIKPVVAEQHQQQQCVITDNWSQKDSLIAQCEHAAAGDAEQGAQAMTVAADQQQSSAVKRHSGQQQQQQQRQSSQSATGSSTTAASTTTTTAGNTATAAGATTAAAHTDTNGNDGDDDNNDNNNERAADDSSDSSSSSSDEAGERCAVCLSASSYDTDPILFCDGVHCGLAVHMSCYGLHAVPEGDWWCDACTDGHGERRRDSNRWRCCLCKGSGGALKREAEGERAGSGRKLAHIVCALW